MTTTEPTTAVDQPGPSEDDTNAAPPQPYQDTASFDITKPYDLGQLLSEINDALKRHVEGSVSGPDDPYSDPSETNVAHLYLTPGDVDAGVVDQAIVDHSPTPGWTVPDHEKVYRAVLQKVVDDPEGVLTTEDVEVAVRGLLLRSTLTSTPLLSNSG